MHWLVLVSNLLNRVPIERVIFPPRDHAKSLEKFLTSMTASVAQDKPPVEQNTAPDTVVNIQELTTAARSGSEAAPTTSETIAHLRRRLTASLSQLEDDLIDGARIAGRPCDCLDKHAGKTIPIIKELSSMETKPVYSEMLGWFESHEAPFMLSNVRKNPPEFYRSMAPEVRRFRKEASGSEAPPDADLPGDTPMRQRAQEFAKRVHAGELSRSEAVAMLADDLAKESS